MAPLPKPPGQRVRRGTTQAHWKTLPPAAPFKRPALPKRSPAWLASTRKWWSTLWDSPIALRWGDLELDGDSPRVKVRRALVKGTLKPPKSRHARRDVPLSLALVSALRERRGEADALAFASRTGTPLDHSNMLQRVLRPAAEEAGAGWAGFHTFRHTCASMLFERGANAVQVQRWLGHHSPAFTLATYVHLLDSGVGEPLELAAELAQGVNRVQTRATGNGRTQPESVFLKPPISGGKPQPAGLGRSEATRS